MLISLPIRDNKGPEWFGAIGTVATLIGTIWLATDVERAKRRGQLDRATFAAAKMLVRINILLPMMNSVRAFLAHSLSGSDPRPEYLQAAKVLQTAGIWSADDLEPLVHLPKQTAAKLEMVRSRLEMIVAALVVAGSSSRTDLSQVGNFYMSTECMLSQAEKEMQVYYVVCFTFLAKHGFSS